MSEKHINKKTTSCDQMMANTSESFWKAVFGLLTDRVQYLRIKQRIYLNDKLKFLNLEKSQDYLMPSEKVEDETELLL